MKELLTPDTVKAAFLTRLSRQPHVFGVAEALQALCDFYCSTAIRGVDPTVPDYDALLFEYGTADWHANKAPCFTVALTRQFQVDGDEEFYQ